MLGRRHRRAEKRAHPAAERGGAMAVPTTLNPWREQGIPLDKQFRSWKEVAKSPYDKLDVDAYTRTRVILKWHRDRGLELRPPVPSLD